jgi:AcrR family transcriptional regulator
MPYIIPRLVVIRQMIYVPLGMKKEKIEKPVRSRGRPREFEINEALEAATKLFWERGYEGLTVDELVRGMGLSKPSFYAAFRDKPSVFHQVVERYETANGSSLVEALQSGADARSGLAALLHTLAYAYTRNPNLSQRGCLVSTGMLNSSPELKWAMALLADRRAALHSLIKSHLKNAGCTKSITTAQDASDLAAYFTSVAHGMAVRARDGASFEELSKTAELAMKAWGN